MSAVVLREAAALIRERAKAATCGPWFALSSSAVFNPSVATRLGIVDDLESEEWVAEASPNRYGGRGDADAEHIASWHPAVALAVADWLEVTAETRDAELLLDHSGEFVAALAVARAYLGT